jgi:hypothetical protein
MKETTRTLVQQGWFHHRTRRIVSLPGPEAYALDAPQPAGLLCNPEFLPPILDVPANATKSFHIHTTQEILVTKGGTSWARIVQ